MSQTFVAPAPPSRRRLLVLALLAAAALAALVARQPRAVATIALPAPEPVCELTGPLPPPPKPVPGPDIYAALAECLRHWPEAHVTADEVRHFVEVEHDPIWLEDGAWWLPLSGESQPDYPSGLFAGVAPGAPVPCQYAIIN